MAQRKYSRVHVYKYGEHKNRFRYNYETCYLQYIAKAKESDIRDLEEDLHCGVSCLESDARASLDSINETGYYIIDQQMLSPDHWKESPDYYMDIFSEEIACEWAAMCKEFGI